MSGCVLSRCLSDGYPLYKELMASFVCAVAKVGQVCFCVCLSARVITEMQRITWIGTSMGGCVFVACVRLQCVCCVCYCIVVNRIIGMMLAASPNTPIARLVLNDIGPFVSKVGVNRLIECMLVWYCVVFVCSFVFAWLLFSLQMWAKIPVFHHWRKPRNTSNPFTAVRVLCLCLYLIFCHAFVFLCVDVCVHFV